MFCYSCGKKILTNGKFCPYCGSKTITEIQDNLKEEVVSAEMKEPAPVTDHVSSVVIPANPLSDNFTAESIPSPNATKIKQEADFTTSHVDLANEQQDSEKKKKKTKPKKHKKLVIVLCILISVIFIIVGQSLVQYLKFKSILNSSEQIVVLDEGITIAQEYDDLELLLLRNEEGMYGVNDYFFDEVLPCEFKEIRILDEYIIATNNNCMFVYDIYGSLLQSYAGYSIDSSVSQDIFTQLLDAQCVCASKNSNTLAILSLEGNLIMEFDTSTTNIIDTNNKYILTFSNNDDLYHLYDYEGALVRDISGDRSMISGPSCQLLPYSSDLICFINEVKPYLEYTYRFEQSDGTPLFDNKLFDNISYNRYTNLLNTYTDDVCTIYTESGTKVGLSGYNHLFTNDLENYIVRDGEKFGMMTKSGETILPFVYDNVTGLPDDTNQYFCFEKRSDSSDSEYCITTAQGQIVLTYQGSEPRTSLNGEVLVVSANNTDTVYNYSGEILMQFNNCSTDAISINANPLEKDFILQNWKDTSQTIELKDVVGVNLSCSSILVRTSNEYIIYTFDSDEIVEAAHFKHDSTSRHLESKRQFTIDNDSWLLRRIYGLGYVSVFIKNK